MKRSYETMQQGEITGHQLNDMIHHVSMCSILQKK